jgi:membrane-bound serine protease (ClpP class)
MLFDANLPFLQISWQVIAAVVITVTLFFVFAVGMVVRAQKKQPRTGREGMVGEQGEVFKALKPEGTVKIHGEFWKAVSDTPVKKGTRVEVVQVDPASLELKVKPIK